MALPPRFSRADVSPPAHGKQMVSTSVSVTKHY
jgi:hypothetical protein